MYPLYAIWLWFKNIYWNSGRIWKNNIQKMLNKCCLWNPHPAVSHTTFPPGHRLALESARRHVYIMLARYRAITGSQPRPPPWPWPTGQLDSIPEMTLLCILCQNALSLSPPCIISASDAWNPILRMCVKQQTLWHVLHPNTETDGATWASV